MAGKIAFRGEVDQGSVELFVRFHTGTFTAESSAWFPSGKLTVFSDELAAYPLPEDAHPKLCGGVWDCDGQNIIQSQVEISVRPAGRRGQLVIFVRLTELDDAHDAKSSAFTSINVSYQEVERMREAIVAAVGSSRDWSEVSFLDFV